MAELIPDAWRFQDEEGTKCCHRSRRQGRRGPVCDILLWIDCYSTMVQVLLTRFPDKAYELVSYQRTIIAAERDYEDEAWVTYDTCFRRQAAARKDLNWSQIDFTLYNQSFAGRAKSKSRCRHCLSEFHRSAVCDYAPESPPPPKRLPQGRGDSQRLESRNQQATELCRLFNGTSGNTCRFKPCKYRHACKVCWGSHPQIGCPKKQPPAQERARMQPPAGQEAGHRTR